MIDIESQVVNYIKDSILDEFPDCNIESTLNLAPSKFPTVSIEETDNYALTTTRDSATTEHDAVVTYSLNVFSNKAFGKKAEAKAILAVADEAFSELEFTRLSAVPMYANDSSVYRISARYRAVVSKDEEISRS